MEFLFAFLIQICSTAGIIFIFGSLIAWLRRAFCALTGRGGPKILLATGIIGTPIHELSHALMCLLFGHKITEIKLYQPRSQDGTLGYVSHTYNKRNIYHQIGNFFIGIAPVVIGSGFILLFMLLLIPETFDAIFLDIELLSLSDISSLPIADYFTFIWNSIISLFSGDNLESWQGWIFIVLALMISTHMEMSGSDIKSGLKGFLFIAVILLLLDGVIFLVSPETLTVLNETALSFGLILSAFLSISLLFLFILVLVALVFKGLGAVL